MGCALGASPGGLVVCIMVLFWIITRERSVFGVMVMGVMWLENLFPWLGSLMIICWFILSWWPLLLLFCPFLADLCAISRREGFLCPLPITCLLILSASF